jgi:hypothetical protein
LQVKSCVKVLKEQQPGTNPLLNALKYSTKHLNDIDSPKTVRAMLDVAQ